MESWLEQEMRSRSEPKPSGLGTMLSGCVFLLYVLMITTGMLMVNAVLCLSVHSVFTIFGPKEIVENPQLAPYIGQMFFFLVPVLLTVIEWNLLDRLNRMFRRRV